MRAWGCTFFSGQSNAENFNSEEYAVFDEDCHSVNLFLDFEGVDGGEDDVHRDTNGNVLWGGQPNCAEMACNELGKNLRNVHRDEIELQGLICPTQNWYRINNRIFEA